MGSKLEVDDLALIEAAGDVSLSPDGELVAYCVATVDIEGDRRLSRWRIASATGEPSPPTPDARPEGRAPRWSPDGNAIALLCDRDDDVGLLVLSPSNGSVRELGAFPSVASPAVWSPAGDRIAVSATIPPGSASRIAILDTASGSTELVPGGEHDDTAPSWSPDGAQLAFARAERDPGEGGPSSRICLARVGAGEDPFEVASDLAFASCPSWSPDGGLLACYGTREPRLGLEDPAMQLWILPVAGGPARPAAVAINGVIVPQPPEGPIWSGDGSIFFREARAGDINAVRVAADDPEQVSVLTRDCQVTSLGASRDGRKLAFSACTPVDPGSVHVGDVEAEAQELARGCSPGPVTTGFVRRSFESPHGGTLDGWVQGVGSGPSPQPLLVSMHGGPHNFVGSGFALGHFHRNVLAARGWMVLTLNTSGSGSYGQEFADSIRGRWGERDLPEYLSAVDALVAEGLADPERLAVAGYSYGGYLAAWAICQTERFRAAVIGAPITNLESFRRTSDIGAWYVPWEMGGDSAENSERLRRLSPVNHAERIATPTLILHGEEDRRCPIAQGEELHARIAAAGRTRVELVRYPGAEHLFYSRGRPSQRIDYNRRAVEWVEEHVRGTGANGHSLAATGSGHEARR